MSHSITPYLGLGLSLATFFMFARGILNRSRGRDFNPLPVFILLMLTVGAEFLPSKEAFVEAYGFAGFGSTVLDRFTKILLDFGIGLLLNGAFLAYKREPAKIFVVPGIFAIVLSGMLYGIVQVFQVFSGTCAFGTKDKPTTVELLIELGPDDTICELKQTLSRYHADYERTFDEVTMEENPDLAQYYTVYVDSAQVAALQSELTDDRENVDNAERNRTVRLIEPSASAANPATASRPFSNDPMLAQQWYAVKLAYDQVYTLLAGAKPQKRAVVAILDTGIDAEHEDISSVFGGGKSTTDTHGHGTHCAGLAGAATNNAKGIASLNWEGKYIQLKAYPALGANGSGSQRSIAQAIIQAAEDGADVISLSLGGYSPKAPKVTKDAIAYARSLGAIVVVAAGNSNMDAQNFTPANIDGVITVSAVDATFNKASFSNTNTTLKMPIAAPGVGIMSAVPAGKYVAWDGTSMATPIVAGIIGVMRAFQPQLSTEKAYEMLYKTGVSAADADKTGRVIQPAQAISLTAKAL